MESVLLHDNRYICIAHEHEMQYPIYECYLVLGFSTKSFKENPLQIALLYRFVHCMLIFSVTFSCMKFQQIDGIKDTKADSQISRYNIKHSHNYTYVYLLYDRGSI